MTTHQNSFDADSLDVFADQLRQLRPSECRVDASTLVYEAGFAAGQDAFASSHSVKRKRTIGMMSWAAVLAAAVAGLIAVPLSYRAGEQAAFASLAETQAHGKILPPLERPPALDEPRLVAEPLVREADEVVLPVKVSREPTMLLADWIASLNQRSSSSTMTAFHGQQMLEAGTLRWREYALAVGQSRDATAETEEGDAPLTIGSGAKRTLDLNL